MSLVIRMISFDDDRHNIKCVECGCSPDAIIESDNVKIPICEKCIPTFIHQCFGILKEIGNTCKKCKYFKPSEDGWRMFGGSCDVKGFGYNSLDHDHKICEMFSRIDLSEIREKLL